MLRKFTTLTAIAALVGSLTLSTAVDARGFRSGGWRWGGYYGGYYGGGCWNWWYGRWV